MQMLPDGAIKRTVLSVGGGMQPEWMASLRGRDQFPSLAHVRSSPTGSLSRDLTAKPRDLPGISW